MKKIILAGGLFVFFAGCASAPDIVYRPYPQLLPQHIKKIAVRPFVNKSSYFGLEDRFTIRVVDEFLRDGKYSVVSESSADGVVIGEIRNYILTPVQHDAALVSTVYKLEVLLKVQFYDKIKEVYLWEEPALRGVQFYSVSTLPGGMTEEQAREAVWSILSKDVVKRTIEGFGSVTSKTEKSLPESQK